MVDQLVGSQHLCYVQGIRDELLAILYELKGAVHNLDLAGPLSLVAGHADLGSRNQLRGVFLGAGQLIEEISSVLALGVNGDLALSLVFPPGLGSLYIGLYRNLAVDLSRHILLMGHHLSRSSLLCRLLSRVRRLFCGVFCRLSLGSRRLFRRLCLCGVSLSSRAACQGQRHGKDQSRA